MWIAAGCCCRVADICLQIFSEVKLLDIAPLLDYKLPGVRLCLMNAWGALRFAGRLGERMFILLVPKIVTRRN